MRSGHLRCPERLLVLTHKGKGTPETSYECQDYCWEPTFAPKLPCHVLRVYIHVHACLDVCLYVCTHLHIYVYMPICAPHALQVAECPGGGEARTWAQLEWGG